MTIPNLLEPMFAFPLTSLQLEIIGRITLVFGHIDSEIDLILDHIHRFRPGQLEIFAPAATTGSKLNLLRKSLAFVPDDSTRAAITKAIQALEPILADRNHITHGQWGWSFNELRYVRPGARSARKQQQRFYASELPALYNKVVLASRLVRAAFEAIWGNADASSHVNATNSPFLFGPGLPEPSELHGEFWPPPPTGYLTKPQT